MITTVAQEQCGCCSPQPAVNRIRVLRACEHAAQLVAAVPHDERQQWLAYLLESLESETGDAGIVDQANDVVATRLRCGRW